MSTYSLFIFFYSYSPGPSQRQREEKQTAKEEEMVEDFAEDVKNPGCSHRPDKRASYSKKNQGGKREKGDDGREERKRSISSKQFLSSLKKAKHESFALRNNPKSRITPNIVFKVYSVQYW